MIRRFTLTNITASATASIPMLGMLAVSLVFAGSISIATAYAEDIRAASNAPEDRKSTRLNSSHT